MMPRSFGFHGVMRIELTVRFSVTVQGVVAPRRVFQLRRWGRRWAGSRRPFLQWRSSWRRWSSSPYTFRNCFDWRPSGHRHRLDWCCLHASAFSRPLCSNVTLAPRFWETERVCGSSTSKSEPKDPAHTPCPQANQIRNTRKGSSHTNTHFDPTHPLITRHFHHILIKNPPQKPFHSNQNGIHSRRVCKPPPPFPFLPQLPFSHPLSLLLRSSSSSPPLLRPHLPEKIILVPGLVFYIIPLSFSTFSFWRYSTTPFCAMKPPSSNSSLNLLYSFLLMLLSFLHQFSILYRSFPGPLFFFSNLSSLFSILPYSFVSFSSGLQRFSNLGPRRHRACPEHFLHHVKASPSGPTLLIIP